MRNEPPVQVKKARLAWMCALLAAAVLGALSFSLLFTRPQSLQGARPLLTGWRYQLSADDTPTAIDTLDYLIPFDTDGSLTLTRTMEEHAENPHLLLRLEYARARLLLDSMPLLDTLNDPPGENPGSRLCLVALPEGYQGREFAITITSPYSTFAFSPETMYFGDATSLWALVTSRSVGDIALLFVLGVSGLALLCVSVFGVRAGWPSRAWWANFCFGLFAVLYGLHRAASCDLYLALTPPLLGANVKLTLWYLFPLPLACAVWLRCAVYRRAGFALAACFGALSLCALLGALLRLWTLPETTPVTNYAIIAGVAAAGILVVLEAIKGNALFRFIAPAFALLFASAAVSAVGSGQLYALKEWLIASGVLLLVVLVWAEGVRALVASRRLEDRERQLVAVKAHLLTERLSAADAHNQEIRLLRHDIRHHLAAVGLLQREGKLEEIGAYLDRLNITVEEADDAPYCGHAFVNAILGKAAADCVREGVTFICEADVPEGTSLPDADVCSLLMNMLENAVEAALRAPENGRWVRAQVRVKDGFLVIACRNGRGGEIVRQGGRFLSTKKDAHFHGYGILAMRQIAEKHGSKLNIDYDEGSFSIKTILRLADTEAKG